MSTDNVITFGCRLNAFESEIIRARAQEAGAENTIIINTCAVTGEAVRQARQAIRKTRRENPGARLLVTGCAAQIDAPDFAAMAEVDGVLGNEEKLQTRFLKPGGNDRIRVNDIMSVRETAPHLIGGFEGRSRAFVQIQTGCDHRCSFCIIPFARGNSRSVPPDHVIEQVRKLVDEGFREVVLTGVDLTSYGPDLSTSATLGRLCRRILDDVPGLPRLRLSSIDSIEVDEGLFDIITNEPRLMPHLHLSLQSGDDIILKRMKRRHTAADAVDFCTAVRRARPDMVLGADFIAGFPTETEEMFANTLRHVEECGISFLHVFPYSRRPGTAAERMPQLPKQIRKERARRLRQAGEAVRRDLLRRCIGKKLEVLVEKRHSAGATGHAPNFARVNLTAPAAPGEIVRVHIHHADDQALLGEPCP